MRRIDGAIFDLDGTLLDSMQIWDTLAADYLRSLQIEPLDGLFEKTRLMTLRQTAEYFIAEYSVGQTVDEIERGVNERIEAFYFHEANFKTGACELLSFFREYGVKMCVVTATEKYLAEAALSRCGLLGMFDFILTCGDLGFGKDSPAIFEHALEMLGTQKRRTFVFEDAIHAIRAAKQAGFPVVAVYDQSFANERDELKETADFFAETLTETRDYFA
ncbi:MAG: HAD family phosphatase [Gracilibacteraceae bacterium]|jgi:beta-phosphoglucomutase-like phosphatase (HAD superfamily)|nr:HAD family phosphatase [Gracilibacteraceae bacterium]